MQAAGRAAAVAVPVARLAEVEAAVAAAPGKPPDRF
jgi:hypothetical protein